MVVFVGFLLAMISCIIRPYREGTWACGINSAPLCYCGRGARGGMRLPARSPDLPASVRTPVFASEGVFRAIGYVDYRFLMGDLKGLGYLQDPLRCPNREFDSLEPDGGTATNDAEERPVSGPRTYFFRSRLCQYATLNFSIATSLDLFSVPDRQGQTEPKGVAFIWYGLELLECTTAPRLAKLVKTNGAQLESARQNREFRLNR
jgi:hypothetical protein